MVTKKSQHAIKHGKKNCGFCGIYDKRRTRRCTFIENEIEHIDNSLSYKMNKIDSAFCTDRNHCSLLGSSRSWKNLLIDVIAAEKSLRKKNAAFKSTCVILRS